MKVIMDADCLIKLTKAGLKEQVCMDLPLSEAMEALQSLGITGNTGMDDTLASLRSLPKSNR